MPESSKHCEICGKDCDGQPRMKDVLDRYYHKKCIELEQEKKAQKSLSETDISKSSEETGIEIDPMDLMEDITSESMHGVHSQQTCTSCGFPMLAGNEVCVKCGFDSKSGFALEGDNDYESAPLLGKSFWDKASDLLTTNFVVGMAIFIGIIAIILLVLTIKG